MSNKKQLKHILFTAADVAAISAIKSREGLLTDAAAIRQAIKTYAKEAPQ